VRPLAPLLFLLAGCDVLLCGTGDITGGPRDGILHTGDVYDLSADVLDFDAGPGDCDGHWYVNQLEGGSPEVGTIDNCGHYIAPVMFEPGLEVVTIEASGWDMRGSCADCCPYAIVQLEPVR
jgi:hypothetical protein